MTTKGWLPWEAAPIELPEETEAWWAERRAGAMKGFLLMGDKKVCMDRLRDLLTKWPPGRFYNAGKWRCQKPYVGNWHWWELLRNTKGNGTTKVPAPPLVVPADAEPRYKVYLRGMHPVDVLRDLGGAKNDLQDVVLLAGSEKEYTIHWKRQAYDEKLHDVVNEELEPPEPMEHQIREPVDRLQAIREYETSHLKMAARVMERHQARVVPWAQIWGLMKKAMPGGSVTYGSRTYVRPQIGDWSLWRWIKLMGPKNTVRWFTPPTFIIPFDAEPRYRSHAGGMHPIDVARDMGLEEDVIRVVFQGSTEGKTYSENEWEDRPYEKSLDALSANSPEF